MDLPTGTILYDPAHRRLTVVGCRCTLVGYQHSSEASAQACSRSVRSLAAMELLEGLRSQAAGVRRTTIRRVK